MAPTAAETHYLLRRAQALFSALARAGRVGSDRELRGPARVAAGPDHAFQRSRETQLIPDRARKPRVLSIYGGKLTTWRAVSQRALEALAASPRRRAIARTDQLPLKAD